MKIFLSFLWMFLISCTPQAAPEPEKRSRPETVDAGTSAALPFDAGSSARAGNGHIVLPGNRTCADEYISVTPCDDVTTLTYHDYTYALVEIGGQCWFQENLKTTLYRDGSPLDQPGASNSAWESHTSGAYTWYLNDSAQNDTAYGALYNGYALDNPAGLCPEGWHVPTDCEWMYLEGTLGMSIVDQENTGYRGTDQGGQLKESGSDHWSSTSEDVTNSSGFTALASGWRHANGQFFYLGQRGGWWSSTELNLGKAYRILEGAKDTIWRHHYGKAFGFALRCLKDAPLED